MTQNTVDTNLLLTILDLSGVWSFAVSGSLTAMQKRMDFFGVLIVAFATAFGGGTIRDILINRPVFWMHNEAYLYILFIATPVAIIFRNYLQYLRKTLFFFDTIGLGVYTVIGMQIGFTWGYSPMLAICLGTLTACFGGVLRDLLCSEIPLIFHREIYASICIVGGAGYVTMMYFGVSETVTVLVTLFAIIIARFIVVRYKLSLPMLHLKDNMPHA
ncbi:MAG: trimeric intracellular cation channel family protein [Flavobacteriales bacterium]|nr:trimeric intracellular cation channel family protein [Flavobacteriales bacterium]MBQ8649952.1 trimeric intracellular cation channel family protein [Flavobacteriales bacterium]